MKNIAKILILSLSTAIAVPAFAAPHDHSPQKVVKHSQAHQHSNAQKNKVYPSKDWKVGQKVPSAYRGQGYKINYTQYKHLHKPAKNQQWIKVNGDYILINVLNHSIIKILNG
ncbi:MAG: RcnB family protein [Acinetobacter venetianus]|uniref:RcnB family protein n=1 Tax=Acinetobacter venetianus TaxID=52133 RepID=UPI003C7925C9